MHDLPVATYLAAAAVRRQFDPDAPPEPHRPPPRLRLRLPRAHRARSRLAGLLHAAARAVAPPSGCQAAR